MAIKTMSYHEVPANLRKSQSTTTLARLRSTLGDPTVSTEARAKDKASTTVSKIQKWASGTLT